MKGGRKVYAIDFEYDGQYLSDYGFIICNFDAVNGVNVTDTGSKIIFNKVSLNNGKNYSLTSSKYNECIHCSFDICKNPDLYSDEDREISDNEYRTLMRWLNRREFLKFQLLDEEPNERTPCYFNVSFNISKIKIAEKLYGLRLTLESDKPFGYGEDVLVSWDFSDISTTKVLSDISDEIGYIYPNMTITCDANGDLSISNELENCTMVIKNCSVGETIFINGEAQTISTSYNSHDICNDFNYEFFRIGNTIDNRNNRISVSKPCHIVIKYTPIIKDTP